MRGQPGPRDSLEAADCRAGREAGERMARSCWELKGAEVSRARLASLEPGERRDCWERGETEGWPGPRDCEERPA